MDGSSLDDTEGTSVGGVLDPSTTYCPSPACEQLRRIVKVLESHAFPILERVDRAADGGRWEDTGRVGFERNVCLECEHTKGLIGA